MNETKAKTVRVDSREYERLRRDGDSNCERWIEKYNPGQIRARAVVTRKTNTRKWFCVCSPAIVYTEGEGLSSADLCCVHVRDLIIAKIIGPRNKYERLDPTPRFSERYGRVDEMTETWVVVGRERGTASWSCTCSLQDKFREYEYNIGEACLHIRSLIDAGVIRVKRGDRRTLAEREREASGETDLPDTDQWVDRIAIPSATTSTVYIVARRRNSVIWKCSCPAGVTGRKCKHLRAVIEAAPEKFSAEFLERYGVEAPRGNRETWQTAARAKLGGSTLEPLPPLPSTKRRIKLD